MAGVSAIYSVGESIATYLRNSYSQAMRDDFGAADFRLISSGELADEAANFETSVTLFLHRVSINEHSRNARTGTAVAHGIPLALNLHYLLTVWAGTAALEHVLLAWVMRQLHEHPLLDAGALSPDGGWHADEVIHVIPSELTNEDLMRIWDTLRPPYRLSHSYVARVVRIDPQELETTRPVVVRRRAVEDVE